MTLHIAHLKAVVTYAMGDFDRDLCGQGQIGCVRCAFRTYIDGIGITTKIDFKFEALTLRGSRLNGTAQQQKRHQQPNQLLSHPTGTDHSCLTFINCSITVIID